MIQNKKKRFFTDHSSTNFDSDLVNEKMDQWKNNSPQKIPLKRNGQEWEVSLSLIANVELLKECHTSHLQWEVSLCMMISMMIVVVVDESDRNQSEEKNYHTS